MKLYQFGSNNMIVLTNYIKTATAHRIINNIQGSFSDAIAYDHSKSKKYQMKQETQSRSKSLHTNNANQEELSQYRAAY